MQQSRDGNHLQAALLSALLPDCDSDRDRAAILLGQSSCYSRLQNIAKSRELLESAKMCAIEHRDLLSQVEMSEAAIYALEDRDDLASQGFASVKSRYSDLLALPENDDFATELDSRLACAWVDVGRYDDAIELFRALLKRDQLDDKQRLQLYYGVAQLRTGNVSEARFHLFEAMSGNDPGLAQSASDFLSSISGDPVVATRLT